MNYYNYGNADNDESFKRQKVPYNLGFNDNTEFKPVKIDKINGKLLDNIIEYNKNLTPDEVNGTTTNNILKYDNLMLLSEFDKMLIAKQYEQLYGKTVEANVKQNEAYQNSKFYNMTLREIFDNFTKTMIELMEEIPIAYSKNELNVNMIMKDDRMTYIGIFLLLLSIFLYFINLTI